MNAEKYLDKLCNMGYCVEIFKQDHELGKYLLFVWPDVDHTLRPNRHLICSRYGNTIESILAKALNYLENQ